MVLPEGHKKPHTLTPLTSDEVAKNKREMFFACITLVCVSVGGAFGLFTLINYSAWGGDPDRIIQYGMEYPELVPEIKEAFSNNHISISEYNSIRNKFNLLETQSKLDKLPNGKVPVESEL